MNTIPRFITDDSGADLVEYALLVGLVSIAAITALGGVTGAITGLFTRLSTRLGLVTFP
jgi:Flp pilus assembly pilin Flp